MGIKATCHCGAQFMAKPELAGRTVKCPTCGQSFQVPKPASTVSQSTFQVACQCGRTYQVQPTMVGRPVRCKACGQQFVVPQAPSATPQSPTGPTTPTVDPLAVGPLDDLGDLSSFDDPLGGPIPATNPSANQAMHSAPLSMPSAVAQPKAKKSSGSQVKVVSIVLGSLVVVAIIGIAVGTFVFFPSQTKYKTPQAVWEAQKKATEDQDWRTLYRTLTPDTRDRMVGGIAFMSQMVAATDDDMAAIVEKHGVGTQAAAPDTSSPEGIGEMFAQMQQQIESSAASIKDKESFFVDVMTYFTENGEEMQGANQQLSMLNTSQALKDVVIDGDNARGMQTINVMGSTIDIPIEFRRIDDSWLIHQLSAQEMMNQAASGGLPFGGTGTGETAELAPAGQGMSEPTDAGKTPTGTLEAYYYYGDRGQQSKLADLITNNLTDEPLKDGPGRGAQTQAARGLIVDHEEINGDEAILYFRTWFSVTAARRGGRPSVARLVKEGGTWKLDVKETLRLTLQNSKGKSQGGFYDGSEEWWK